MTSGQKEYIDLYQYWFTLRRHWFPASAVLVLIIILTSVFTFLKKPVYQANGQLLLKKTNGTSSLTDLGKEIGELNSLQTNPLDTEAEIIRSISVSPKVMTALNLKNKDGTALKRENFLRQLDIKSIKGTDVLQISYKSNNPDEAVKVVNQLMLYYVEHNMYTNRSEAIAARKFIEEQLPKTEATVRQAEIDLRKFKENNRIVSLQQESKTTVENIGELEKQISQTRANLADAKSRAVALQKKVGMNSQQATAIAALSQSAGIQTALEELQKVENQLAVERTRFQEESPVIINLKNKQLQLKSVLQTRAAQVLGNNQPSLKNNLQIGKLQEQLIGEFIQSEVKRSTLTSELATLSQEVDKYKQRSFIIPKLEESQLDLERKVKAAQSSYETLLKKLQEIRITENQNLGNARILQAALLQEKAVSPNIFLNLGIGTVAGIILGIVTAFVLEAKDTSIKTVREAVELLEYTLVGIIPDFDKCGHKNAEQCADKLPARDNPSSLISENYRMIYANLKFLNSDKQLKIFTVTSATPQEGKSTVSANLAVVIAQLGFRVLVIDADMRHPSQHHIWEFPNTSGLSNVIVEQIELRTAVKQVLTNLYILNAGVLPPNPLALLNSKRMASLIEEFSQNYDFVFIDTPPLNVAADARILGAMADGIIVVVQPKLVDSASAISVKELLQQSNLNVLGMVINRVNPDNEPDSYFYAREYPVNKDFSQDVNIRFRNHEHIER